MSAIAKMIVGIIVFLIGIYWYLPSSLVNQFIHPHLNISSTAGSFLVVFFGLFGLVLIFLGIVIAWIEFEDFRWSRREKAEKHVEKKEKKK